MAKNISILLAKMPPAARKQAELKAIEMIKRIKLLKRQRSPSSRFTYYW